ncbi:MAG: M23 family metallopeptidase [Deltaproteobacteria bacterium]|nr:MAG: M23 family metallopeptidase [Deltaproteobacteria bacterium]
MHLAAPPDGRPWALIGLCGASLTMNVLLSAVLLWPSPQGAEHAPVQDEAVAEALTEPLAEPEPVAEPEPTALPVGVERFSAPVERNLAYTFRKAAGDIGDALSATTARLFVWDLDLRRDLQRGDHVQVAWTVEADLPVVLAARYASQKKGELVAYRFHATGDDFPSYWDAEGTEVPHVLKECPLQQRYDQITSLLKDRPTHKGMDFKVPVGAPVVTPRAGKVVRTNWNFTYNGNAVEVRWADGTLARFLHLSETLVQPGQSLAAGEVVGKSGNTGRSTAPHLHYELEKGGKVLDPAKVHGTLRRSLPPADLERFAQERVALDALLLTDGV